MPTTIRIAIPDVPVHIRQRGNSRRDIVFVDSPTFSTAPVPDFDMKDGPVYFSERNGVVL